jgi:hypothetical protein
MKRLLVRLSLLSALVATGVFAIYQSQRERSQSREDGQESPPAISPQVPLLAPGELAAEDRSSTHADAAFRLIPLPDQLAETKNDSFVMPAPSDAIVRGNDGSPDETTALAQPSTAANESEGDFQADSYSHALAQAGGRARNPFARRDEGLDASNQDYQAPRSSDSGENTAAAETTTGNYRFGGPALASANDEEIVPTPETGEPATSPRPAYAAAPGAYGNAGAAPTPAEPQPSALGAPRELPEFPTAGGDQPSRLSSSAGGNGAGYSFGGGRADSQKFASPTEGDAARGNSRSASPGVEGAGAPGPQSLEGAQTPSITLKKTAPPEIQVGKLATFEIHVQNVGRIAAHQVIVKEDIPAVCA